MYERKNFNIKRDEMLQNREFSTSIYDERKQMEKSNEFPTVLYTYRIYIHIYLIVFRDKSV